LHVAEVINFHSFTAGKEGPSQGRQTATEKNSDDTAFSAPDPFPYALHVGVSRQ